MSASPYVDPWAREACDLRDALEAAKCDLMLELARLRGTDRALQHDQLGALRLLIASAVIDLADAQAMTERWLRDH